VELDALAELEFDRLVVDALPLGGETRARHRLPSQSRPISASQSEVKKMRSPTLDCSRSTSSVLELTIFCTAMVMAGRLSDWPMANCGTSGAAPASRRRVQNGTSRGSGHDGLPMS
jgi:hypothetical protein